MVGESREHNETESMHERQMAEERITVSVFSSRLPRMPGPFGVQKAAGRSSNSPAK
jgi:hypothetical protein